MQRQITLRTIENTLLQSRVSTLANAEEKDQKEFVEGLVRRKRFMRGEDEPSDKIDRAALESMRQFFNSSKNSKIGAGKKV